MNIDWAQGRCHAVVCASTRLLDEEMAPALAAWGGPVHRHVEPDSLPEMVVGLDTPSLFEAPALELVRCDEAWLKRQRKHVERLIGVPAAAGVLVFVLPKLGAREDLAKAFKAAGCLHKVELPEREREVEAWLVAHLLRLEGEVQRPPEIAATLVAHRGTGLDGLLAALDQALDHSDGTLTVADVEAVVGGDAERPLWEFTDAALGGRVADALACCHRGKGIDPEPALASLAGELRRLIACHQSEDDAEASVLAGSARRGNLRHVRRRARSLRPRLLERLLDGVIQTQRACRRGGDAELALEQFLLNLQRVIRSVAG